MFVSCSPDMVFDVERHNDRCVCGCSALVTCRDHDNVDFGYCDICAKKRTDFVNQITGTIQIGEENSFESSILDTIENIRKSIFKERFYYMVDNYFGQHQNDDQFIEPYGDASFIAKIYREKCHMTEIFLSSIILQKEKKFSCLNRTKRVFSYYKSELEKMTEEDYEILCKFTAKAGGYSYKRENQ